MTRSDWFVTATGRQVYVRDPEPDSIAIDDIAHALAYLCRFGGHTREFYSVAQHSVHVSKLVPAEHQLVGLMHDATEAYLGDVIRPLKRELAGAYGDLEARWWAAIATRFALPLVLPEEVHQADVVALATERRDLITHHGRRWLEEEDLVPDPRPIRAWSPDLARWQFLGRFRDLTVDTLPPPATDDTPDTIRSGGAQ